jgi:hypothetical protein
MELKDREVLVSRIVDKVFVPLILVEISKFLEEYKKQIIFARDMQHISGYPLKMPTVIIDIRQATNILIDHLNTALKNESTTQG